MKLFHAGFDVALKRNDLQYSNYSMHKPARFYPSIENAMYLSKVKSASSTKTAWYSE